METIKPEEVKPEEGRTNIVWRIIAIYHYNFQSNQITTKHKQILRSKGIFIKERDTKNYIFQWATKNLIPYRDEYHKPPIVNRDDIERQRFVYANLIKGHMQGLVKTYTGISIDPQYVKMELTVEQE